MNTIRAHTVEISAALQTLLQTRQADSLGLLKLLKPGMLLQAKVSAGTLQGVARLQVGANELQARTQIPLRAGEALSLRVEKGLPLPELKILQPSAQTPTQALLKHALARQLPSSTVQDGLRQVAQLLRQPASLPGRPMTNPQPAASSPLPTASAGTASPTSASNPAQQVLKVLLPATAPGSRATGPAQVQQAFQNSGIFFEHTLLSTGSPASTDQKYQLLQLLRLFTSAARAEQRPEVPVDPQTGRPQLTGDQLMTRLLRLIEGSLGRIQGQQVASMPDEGGKQVWHFEMPLQVNERKEHLQLRIQREGEGSENTGKGAVWKVDIKFDFDNLGPISAQVSLRDEQFSIAFWSQRESTAQRIEGATASLYQQMLDAGLKIKHITSVTGDPPDDQTKPSIGLLDERA